MNFDQSLTQPNPSEAKNVRIIITVGLILLLLAIVVGYIYYGMQLARQAAIAPTPTADPVLVVDEAAILSALEAAPSSPTDPVAAQAIVTALEAEVEVAAPAADNTLMLQALGYPSN